jgi:hypothetical protein
MMALFGGADEYIVRAVEPFYHLLEARHVAFDQLRRSELLLRRGLQHFDAVLVGPGDEEHVIAVKPHEPGDCIGRDRLVGVADMGRAIGIGDGRGEVVAGLVSHRSIPWSVVIPCWALPTQRADLSADLGTVKPRSRRTRIGGRNDRNGRDNGSAPTKSAGVPTRP